MHTRPTGGTTAETELPAELARTLLTYLSEPRGHERGGVLLGQRETRRISVSGAVFPPQLASARDHCAFDAHGIDVVRRAMTELTGQEITRTIGTIVGWVHSHPRWGVFMSNTDHETFRSWIGLDDRAIAIVVDPFVREPSERIAFWDKNGRGRPEVPGGPGEPLINIQQGSLLAQAIRNHVAVGRWDVLVPEAIITILPADPRTPSEPQGTRNTQDIVPSQREGDQ